MPDYSTYERLSLAPTEISSEDAESAEFVVVSGTVPYCPRLLPTYTNTIATTILPIYGLEAPFAIDSGLMTFDSSLSGYLLRVVQSGSAVNGQAVRRFAREEPDRRNFILDGCTSRLVNGDIYMDSGLVAIRGAIYPVAGIRLRVSERLSSLLRDYGFAFSVFICEHNLIKDGGMVVPNIETVEILGYQLGDYRGLYSAIRSNYSVDYSSSSYVNLVRGQVLSQEPSDPYLLLTTSR